MDEQHFLVMNLLVLYKAFFWPCFYRSDDVKPKYQSSPLDDQLSENLVTKLESVMQESKPYKDNNLKLEDLAELVGVSPIIYHRS